MKFTILQQDFLPVIQSVSRSVGIRSQLPVLDNILLSCEDKKLKIAATNLEVGIVKYVPAGIEEEGAVTVPSKTLLELIAGLGSGKIEVVSQGEIIEVRSGSLHATINGITAAEFPAIPVAQEQSVKFPKQILASSSQILFAAAVDEGRPVLTGILTEVKNKKLDFVATDGFRLAHRQIDLPDGGPTQFRSLIPRRTFEEVLKMLDEEDAQDISVATSGNQNQIVFSMDKTILSSRLIEGQFPAWEKIIPQKMVSRAVVTAEDLLKAVKLAAVFSKSEANIVIIEVKPKSLILKSQAKELGSQENEVEAQVEGEELSVAFNTKFLNDVLSAAGSKQVILEFSGALSACLIKPMGVDGLEYIIMPVRLN